MIDEGQIILARQMAIGGEQPILIILAPRDAEFQRLWAGRCQGQRSRPAARRLVAAQRKPIPIGAIGLQARDLDMDAMAQFGPRDRFARRDYGLETVVAGHFPFYRQRHGGHTAMRLEGLGRQLGPDDEAVRRRIARRHAQRKGVAGKPALRLHDGGHTRQRSDGGGGQYLATGQHGAVLSGREGRTGQRHRHPTRAASRRSGGRAADRHRRWQSRSPAPSRPLQKPGRSR